MSPTPDTDSGAEYVVFTPDAPERVPRVGPFTVARVFQVMLVSFHDALVSFTANVSVDPALASVFVRIESTAPVSVRPLGGAGTTKVRYASALVLPRAPSVDDVP